MVEERDFTNCKELRKGYEGASGGKKCLVIDGEPYMVKFPAASKRNPNISYTNSCISEYLGCHVFDSVGIPVQKTMLGTYTTQEGRRKVVVACKDMTRPGVVLQSFIAMKNQAVDSSGEGTGTELANIEEAFQKQTLFDQKALVERFWDMFIVDALIGNFDRHNGNWGVLVDSTPTNPPRLAPVYDCGNCLGDKWDESKIEAYLSSGDFERASAATAMPSIFTRNGKKINPCAFISRHEHPDCDAAVRRIVPRIMAKLHGIDDLLASTPYMDDLHRRFYTSMMKERLSHSLLPAFNELEKEKTRHKALDRF